MDTLAFPLSNQVAVIIAPHGGQPQMLELAAHLGVQGPLLVLDCGNRFNVYPVARAIRRRTPALKDVLDRIRLARAFTCYQVLALLVETSAGSGATLVLDLLNTFYDEDVKLPEARRLLGLCLGHLVRLSRQAPLVVSVSPPKPVVFAERMALLEMLRQVAGSLWEAGIAPPPPAPPAGFPWAAAPRPSAAGDEEL